MRSFDRIHQQKNSIAGNNGSKFFFQPKLTINTPGDSYEKEADVMAGQVMRMKDPFIQSKPSTKQDKKNMQGNENSSGGHESTKQTFFKPAISIIQRKCEHCELEKRQMQRKEINTAEISADGGLENYVAGLHNGGQSLPAGVRNFYEPRFGNDFGDVKVHTDSVAAKSAQSVNALAYTSGNNIVFNKDQYNPHTDSGKKLLAHELTHVVQQNSNHVSKQIQRTRLHFYDYNDNFARRGGYAADYCEDYSYITGQCNTNIPGNKHAAIDNVTQVPGWVSLFHSRGHTINEVIFHTHGAPGYVHLPNGGLTAANVSSIAGMGSDLASDALIDFKGCNVAEGPAGEAFLLAVANTVLSVPGGRAKGTDSVTFSVPGIGQRRPIWSSRPTACVAAGGAAHMC